MKELLLAPLAILIVFGFVTQLGDIAMSSSEKALNYADNANNALDCAFKGIPIEVCSPELMDTNFEPETREYIDFNKKMMEKYGVNITELLDEINKTNSTN